MSSESDIITFGILSVIAAASVIINCAILYSETTGHVAKNWDNLTRAGADAEVLIRYQGWSILTSVAFFFAIFQFIAGLLMIWFRDKVFEPLVLSYLVVQMIIFAANFAIMCATVYLTSVTAQEIDTSSFLIIIGLNFMIITLKSCCMCQVAYEQPLTMKKLWDLTLAFYRKKHHPAPPPTLRSVRSSMVKASFGSTLQNAGPPVQTPFISGSLTS